MDPAESNPFWGTRLAFGGPRSARRATKPQNGPAEANPFWGTRLARGGPRSARRAAKPTAPLPSKAPAPATGGEMITLFDYFCRHVEPIPHYRDLLEQPRIPAGPQPTRVPARPQPTRVPARPQPSRVPAGPQPTRVPARPQPCSG